MSEIAVLVNRRAGSGRGELVWADLRTRDPRLADAHVVCAVDTATARAELGRVLDSPIELVIAIGGDGTAHLAGNVILERGLGSQVALGLIPTGTGSDLSRALGIPRNPAAALKRALSAGRKAIDVLRIETDDGRREFVLNVASAGISGLVDEMVNALPRRSALSYLGATLGAVLRYRPAQCRVTVDDEVWHEGGLLLIAVANSDTFGNGMRIAPGAKIDDGAADVVLVRQVPRWQLPIRLPQVYLGTHVRTRFVRTALARTVRLEPLAPMPPFDLDGEMFDPGPATITIQPGALLVPG